MIFTSFCDQVLYNAGALLFVAGAVSSIKDGVIRARAAVADGSAYRTFQAYIHMTQNKQP